jgi:hypothetical protein
MTQPLGNCPGCGTDEPFAQIHPDECPDVAGDCPEWACVVCGAGVIMGTIPVVPTLAMVEPAPARPSVRAA